MSNINIKINMCGNRRCDIIFVNFPSAFRGDHYEVAIPGMSRVSSVSTPEFHRATTDDLGRVFLPGDTPDNSWRLSTQDCSTYLAGVIAYSIVRKQTLSIGGEG